MFGLRHLSLRGSPAFTRGLAVLSILMLARHAGAAVPVPVHAAQAPSALQLGLSLDVISGQAAGQRDVGSLDVSAGSAGVYSGSFVTSDGRRAPVTLQVNGIAVSLYLKVDDSHAIFGTGVVAEPISGPEVAAMGGTFVLIDAATGDESVGVWQMIGNCQGCYPGPMPPPPPPPPPIGGLPPSMPRGTRILPQPIQP